MSEVVFKDGDIVLIRGRIVNGDERPLVDIGASILPRPPSSLDIVSIEKPNFHDGDRVIAQGHRGVIWKVWPDRQLAWVCPDNGGDPWTVNIADCRREPPAPPSAEITPLVPRREAAE